MKIKVLFLYSLKKKRKEKETFEKTGKQLGFHQASCIQLCFARKSSKSLGI